MSRLLFFVGTRPEIIKAAPLFHALRESPELQVDLAHTGQHYDWSMSGAFLDEFGLQNPLHHLEVGSGSQAYQVSEIIGKMEEVVSAHLPSAIIAVGDTNSTLGVALASVKLEIPFIHVEAGLRSFDPTMQEEVNRKIADQISSLGFAPTERAAANLLNEGIPPERIFVTGNTVIDALMKMLPRARRESQVMERLKIDSRRFLVTVTVHRKENVDDSSRLASIAEALIGLDDSQVVWPLHPRAKARLETSGLLGELSRTKHIKLVDPMTYLDFIELLESSTVVATDSGGVQEEVAALKVPCVVLRNCTERPEIVDVGIGVMGGVDEVKILRSIRDFFYRDDLMRRVREAPNPFGDGTASIRIAETIITWAREGKIPFEPPRFEAGAPIHASFIVNDGLDGQKVSEIEGQSVKVTGMYGLGGEFIRPEPGVKLRARQILKIIGERHDIEAFRKKWDL